MILHVATILCFMVGCQDKEAMAELEEFKAQAAFEEQNKATVGRTIEELNKGPRDFRRVKYYNNKRLFHAKYGGLDESKENDPRCFDGFFGACAFCNRLRKG